MRVDVQPDSNCKSDKAGTIYDEYGCLKENLELRLAADLKCTMPFLVYNRVNLHHKMCTNESEFAEAWQQLHESEEDELQLEPTCKPKCEHLSYSGEMNYWTKSGQ